MTLLIFYSSAKGLIWFNDHSIGNWAQLIKEKWTIYRLIVTALQKSRSSVRPLLIEIFDEASMIKQKMVVSLAK